MINKVTSHIRGLLTRNCFPLHDWGEWSDEYNDKAYDIWGWERLGVYQVRTCRTCEKWQIRRVG